jgi:lipopolysaccharide export system protein LptA
MTMKIPALAILTAASLAAVSAAHAQIGRSEAPIQIKSETGEYLQNEGRGVYSGNVEATQGDSKVTTDKLTVVCTRSAANGECEEIRQLVAEGNVLFTAPDEVAIRGDRAEYDYASDTITVTGNVISRRGDEGVVQGTRIVYNVGEGRAKMTAGSERVLSIITPKKKQPATAPAPGAGQPATPPAAPAPRPN